MSLRLVKGLLLVLLGKQEAAHAKGAYEAMLFLIRSEGRCGASCAPSTAREAVKNREESGCDLSHVLMLPSQISSGFSSLTRGRQHGHSETPRDLSLSMQCAGVYHFAGGFAKAPFFSPAWAIYSRLLGSRMCPVPTKV